MIGLVLTAGVVACVVICALMMLLVVASLDIDYQLAKRRGERTMRAARRRG